VPESALTARCVAQFRCIADACEDHCCHGWGVDLDQASVERLRRAMAGSAAEREELVAALETEIPDRPGRTPASKGDPIHVATLKAVGAQANCTFLDGSKLCSVHGRYGAHALPKVCASYPRVFAATPRGVEVFAHFSCPELARLGLLRDDGMELDTLDLSGFPPHLIPAAPAPAADAGVDTDYAACADEVRGFGLAVLSLRAHPIATRLFLLAYAGHKSADRFRRGEPVDRAALHSLLAGIATPAAATAWQGELAQMPISPLVCAQLVTELLSLRFESATGSFRHLVLDVVASLGEPGGVSSDAEGNLTLSLPDVWASFSARAAAWSATSAARLDLYFENFAKAHWLREDHARAPTLLAHVEKLLLRVAVLKFLLLGHPKLVHAARIAELPAKHAALDKVAVEVFYKFSRGVEHSETFLEEMAARLAANRMNSFAHTITLALL
jgi:lysine-N-methylase